MISAVADNDLLFKAASYGLLQAFVVDYVGAGKKVAFLGAAQYMLPKRLARARLRRNTGDAIASLQAWLDSSEPIEPSDEELALAARLERAAQRLGVPLHEGESQLCAVVIKRELELLLTGDKAAIRAVHVLIGEDNELAALAGKVRCLEVIVQTAVGIHGIETVRVAVCSEPDVDKALSIIFSCSNSYATLDGVMEGLESYVADIKRNAPRVFALS